MARFQTKISKARFVVSPFSGEQMAAIGNTVVDSIRKRLARGLDLMDAPTPPLKEGYAKAKARRGLNAIRDWYFSGRTVRSMKTLQANENRAVVGFTDPESNKRAAINNARLRQFGLSPMDSDELSRAVANIHPVRAEKVA